MKNLKQIFLFTIAAGLLFSCEDAMDIEQKGQLTEEIAFRTVDDMVLALAEVYDQVPAEDAIGFTSVFTDETAIGPENGGQNIDLYSLQLFPGNDFASSIWVSNYAVINYANRLIAGSEDVIIDEEDEDLQADLEAEKNRILAEARVLRAFAHFTLLSYFSTDMTDDNALGVILLDHVPYFEEQLPRSTNAEVFAFIEADLAFADENLSAGNSFVQVTPRMVTAFRARMAAYRGNYTLAQTYAQELISAVPLTAAGNGSTSSPYVSMFRDAGASAEVIFGLERPPLKASVNSNWYFNGPGLAGGPFHDMSRSLFNLLSASQGDVRRVAFVGSSSLIAPDYETVFDYMNRDVLIINKYPGISGAPLNNRIKVFRVSEMHFIKAEAMAAANDFAGVAASLQLVKNARTITGNAAPVVPVRDNAAAAWADILLERRLELCFEGHRYIDLKRLGEKAGVSIDRYVRDCAPYNACELSITDHRWTLPIPLDELNGNLVIREQQNPGY